MAHYKSMIYLRKDFKNRICTILFLYVLLKSQKQKKENILSSKFKEIV